MSIYRGPGGAGDATNDATSQSILAARSAQEAAASEAAAASSASSAATSATNAASSATAAASSATSAANSASSATTQAANAASSAATATTKASEATDSATAAASSATAAATSATNASNSATAAANSATSASNSASAASASATNAATYASNAATSATNAAASETNAAASANSASNSATLATASATSAGNSASSATTSATNAASSASAAATSASNAATSATNAANSASSANTSATNASNSASAAATSETNAASSASGAASSASSAAASAAAAAASLDSFDDRYLGSKTADPTLDNDGNALVTGALYYNSVEGEMRVYDGFQWIAASAASQAILVVYKYTATAGQTTFTGTDDNALTLAYTVGSIIVTVNGVVQEVGTDVTASTGTSIVLAVAASAGDEVNIHAFSTFDVANTYTKAEADAKFLRKAGEDGVTVSNGNLGLGVTPSGWGVNYKTLDIGFGSALTNPYSYTATWLSTNAYHNGTNFIYKNSAQATYYAQAAGVHYWSTAPSGTAGNAISFTQAMTLDASGNLGIGTSSPVVYGVHAYRNLANTPSKILAQNGHTGSNFDYAGVGVQTDIISGGLAGWATGSLRAGQMWLSVNESAPLVFGTADTERMRLDSSGNLLVGTTSTVGGSSSGNIHAAGGNAQQLFLRHKAATAGKYWKLGPDNSANNLTIYNQSNAGVYITDGATSWTGTSDERLKTDLKPIENATNKVAMLRAVTGRYKTDNESVSRSFLIAQDVQLVLPEAVDTTNPEKLGLSYTDVIPLLVAAIKELKAELDATKAEVAALKGTVQ